MARLGLPDASLDLDGLVNASPFPYLILSTGLVILGVNDAYLRVAERSREDLLGQHVFDAFPPDLTESGRKSFEILQASLNRALSSGKPDHLAVMKYDILVPSPDGPVFEERYWSIINTPVLDAQGKAAFLFQNPIDVTELVRLQQDGQEGVVQADVDYQIAGSVFSRAQAVEATNRMLGKEREHFLNLFRQAPGFVAIVRGPEHVVDMVNESFYQLVGHRDIVGKPLRDALPELPGQGYDGLLDKVFREGKAFVGRQMKILLQLYRDDPLSERYVDFVCQPISGVQNEIAGIFIQGQDVTEQKRAQDALQTSHERWERAVEGTGDGLWDWDMVTGELLYSKRFREMFGYSEPNFPDRIESWSSRIHPDDLPAAMALLDTAIRTREPVALEYRFLCRDGSWKWVRSRGVAVGHDKHGKPTRMTGTISDISEKRESEERIWYQANFDALTSLPNRRLFRDRLDQEVRKAHRTEHSLCLMFIDLDRFKEVNDLMGHDAGDQLLVEAAYRLTGCVRSSDTVARLGGDEFTVILPELSDLAYVENVAQKILERLAAPFFLHQQTVYVSASIGITLYQADGNSAEQLISNADQAMYAAKNAGRNQFRYFTPSMQEKAQHRLRLANDLRKALAAGQLEVVYQPVVDLATGHIAKAEALLRWNHPLLGRVAPAHFIPIAEETGLINEIGDWVFKQAVGCSQQWQQHLGKTVQISVNASPVQIRSTEPGVNWLHYLEMLGLLGSSIVVEITEGLLLNASTTVADKLFEYRDAGIQVAIDDFGTGYSSMQYLKKFDIDYLKIDQSFVRDMVTDASDRTIVKSIIVMAHELGLQVIAEGIENDEQKELLRTAGCDYAQGFLFSKGVSAAAFAELMVRESQG